MKEKKDQFEQFITDNFEKLAKQEEDKLKNDTDIRMPEGLRESVRAKLDDEIKKIEEQEAYAHLSEEDRKALELGRKLMMEKTEPQEESVKEEGADTGEKIKKFSCRRRLRVCLILAAALVMVMAVGITSLGGPERMIQMLTQNVGEREVEQVDSSGENLVIVEEDEEEAYQLVSDELNIEPVKIIAKIPEMRFCEMYYDSTMKTAELIYTKQSEKIVYIISASYGQSSLGMDLEDARVNEYVLNYERCQIRVTEYNVDDNDHQKYLANFTYNGSEYFLFGEGTKEEFEQILDGLYFY